MCVRVCVCVSMMFSENQPFVFGMHICSVLQQRSYDVHSVEARSQVEWGGLRKGGNGCKLLALMSITVTKENHYMYVTQLNCFNTERGGGGGEIPA